VVGYEYMYSLGPFERYCDWMVQHLNLDPAARMERNPFFRCGGKAVFEVSHYSAPGQRKSNRATATSVVTTCRFTWRIST
jgi:glyoxylase I family protein